MSRLSCRQSCFVQAGAIRAALSLVVVLCSTGCSEDMQQQQSFQSQEAPRRHAPFGSIPRDSRTILPGKEEEASLTAFERRRLFDINCAHCHGKEGIGDGPAAGFLKELPANLQSPAVQTKSVDEIYRILTEGKDMMPSFRGELSARERLELARYVSTLKKEDQRKAADGTDE